ncbi:MAG: autotransporter outer membrane beta-barrel domain-containing protein, partial [Gemmatimonadales bacterium]
MDLLPYRHVGQRLTAFSRGANRTLVLGVLAGLAVGCERSEKDFLDPNATTVTGLSISPRNGSVRQLEPLAFRAYGTTAGGDSAAVLVSWSSSGGVISDDGAFQADLPGQYWIVAQAGNDGKMVDSVVVSVLSPEAPVSQMAISPPSVTLVPGESFSFSSQARTANGALADVPTVWSASTGSIDLAGVYTAPAEDGEAVVIAAVGGGVADTARVLIRTPLGLRTLALSPGNDTMFIGETRPFSVAAEWTDGRTQSPEVDFSATGGVVDGMGIFTAGEVPGAFEVAVRERNGSMVARARIWIRTEAVASVRMRPTVVQITPGTTQLFRATAHGRSGRLLPVEPTWSATGGEISQDGRYTAGREPGTYRVVATAGPAADTSTVVVGLAKATLRDIAVEPATVTLPAGGRQHFSPKGSWSDGGSVVPSVEWSATGGTISVAGEYVAGPVPGTYRVVALASEGSVADTAMVTVGAPILSALEIAPGAATVERGKTMQFSVRGEWSNGSSSAPPVTWSATGGSISSSGLFTAGQSGGTYRVIARHGGGLADSSLVTVTSAAPVLNDLTVSPKTISVLTGAVQIFRVSADWSNDGSGTPSVTWTASGGRISNRGRFIAGSEAGTYSVIVRQAGGTLADTAVVTITPPAAQLTGISLSPATATVQAGGTRQFSVSATWTNGGSGVPAIAWSATGGTIEGNGLFRAGAAAGTYRVIARQQDGLLVDTSIVTVTSTAPQLTGIEVTPATGTLTTGGVLQYSVAGIWTNGGSGAPAVTWTATGGTITSSGRYTAGATAGTYRVVVRQQSGSLADTASVTVSTAPATLTDLRIEPRNITLQTGLSEQFAASATWSNGASTVPPISWSATGGTITSQGRYTAPSTPGSYRVIARHTSGSLADTTQVTVSAPTVTRVSLSPGTATLAQGATQQFQTSATWSDGASRSVAVTYTATGGTITVNGLYTAGRSAGTFLVVATCACGRADTSSVIISGPQPSPTLTSVTISPASISIQAGATQPLSVVGRLTDGSTASAAVSWSATGGTITSGGVYTAGATAGTYRVIATVVGGLVADTIPV